MEQRFPRATAPHLGRLVEALTPILTGSGFHVRYQTGAVQIFFQDFTGKEAAVQAAVDAAPAWSVSVDNQYTADHIERPGSGINDEVAKQGLLTLVDLINVERQQHGRAAITPQAFITEVKSRL